MKLHLTEIDEPMAILSAGKTHADSAEVQPFGCDSGQALFHNFLSSLYLLPVIQRILTRGISSTRREASGRTAIALLTMFLSHPSNQHLIP